MIPEYRGESKDGKVVFGWLNYDAVEKCYFIMENCWFRGRLNITLTTELFYEITQSSLARYTGQKDKHGTPIYGSIELGGVMTEGGDIVRLDVFNFDEFNLYKTMDYNVVFDGGTWIMESIDTNYDNDILHSIGSGLLEIIKGKNKMKLKQNKITDDRSLSTKSNSKDILDSSVVLKIYEKSNIVEDASKLKKGQKIKMTFEAKIVCVDDGGIDLVLKGGEVPTPIIPEELEHAEIEIINDMRNK